jgi:uncharacterized membrane protein YfcA
MIPYILLFLVGLLAGLVKGTSAFGSSLFAIPLLFQLGFLPGEVVTMMITSNIVLNLMLVSEHKHYFNKETMREIMPIIIAGIVFTGLGLYINNVVDARVVEVIAASLIIVAIINTLQIIKIEFKDRKIYQIGAGILSGIGNGIASVDGPPVVFYLSGIKADKIRFKSTLSIHFLIMGIAGVILLAFFGNYNVSVLIDTGVLLLGLMLGTSIGIRISRVISELWFSRIVVVLLLYLAFSLYF